MMRLSDIDGQDGPYWAAYQAERRRARIFDDPECVPFWYLLQIAHRRVAASRTVLEQAGSSSTQEAWSALRTLEEKLRGHHRTPEREMLVLGLLGAQEVEIERERREFNDGVGA